MSVAEGRAERVRLIRCIHAEARARGLDEDARRALQRRAAGKASCADMTAPELRRVIAALGGAPRAHRRDRVPDTPMGAKLRALWISAWHLGVTRERGDAALAAWLRRQSGLDAAAWTTPAGMARAIEALRSWLAREAGVDWRAHIVLGRDGRAREIARPAARVLEAQWRILHRRGVVAHGSLAALGAYAARLRREGRADSHLALDAAQCNALIAHLGARIRAGAAAKEAP